MATKSCQRNSGTEILANVYTQIVDISTSGDILLETYYIW